MRHAKNTALPVVLLSLCLLSGCWSSINMNELGFVMGVAIDRLPRTGEHDYTVTAQIAKPGLLKASGSAPSDGEEAYVNYTAQGRGVESAAINLSRRVNRKLYTGHNQVLVVSSEVAELGIDTIMDSFLRSSDARLTVLLFVAEERAADVFEVDGELEHLPVLQLKSLAEDQNNYGEIFCADIRSFLTATRSELTAPTAPTVRIAQREGGGEELQLSGMAVFKDAALCTTLTPRQGQAMLMVQGRPERGYLEVVLEDRYVGLRINSSAADIRPEFKGDRLERIAVRIDLGCSVVDTDADVDFLAQQARLQVGAVAAEQVTRQLRETLAHTQRFGADVFGFGELLQRYHPKRAAQLLERWDEAYRALEVTFEVAVEILSSGAVMHPLVTGEAHAGY